MSLDLFPQTVAASDQYVAANAAPDVPAGFSEALDVSWRSMTEWQSSTAYENARDLALANYYDDVKRRTGEQLPLYGMGGNVSLDDLNAGIAKLREQRPDDGFMPLTEADIDTMARRRMAAAHDAAARFAARETTWGGTAGTVLGTLAGGLTDPVTLATLPLGGAGTAGIALRGLEFAAIAGGTQAATSALNASAKEAAVPGSWRDIPGEIATASLVGGVFGLGFGALQKLVGLGAKPLPTSAREEINAAASEAQIAAVNPFPTAAGEAAHRDGVSSALQAILRGDPVAVAPSFPYRLPSTVERLSEVQIGEIAATVPEIEARASRAMAALERRDTKTVAKELANVDRASLLDGLRSGIEEIKAERQALQQRIDVASDTAASDRLAAIEQDLQAPALTSKRAAELRQERATIEETLAATSEQDRRALASLQQEAKGLDVLLARRTKEADSLQRIHDRAQAATGAERKAIEADRETVTATLASQTEVVTNELRRSIARLAADGYGVRIDREEAQRLAEQVIANKADQKSLSSITEALLQKANTASDEAAALSGERHLRPLTFEERPVFERFFDMPRADDAGSSVAAATRDLAPEEVAKLAADPKTADAVQRNLDRIRVERPDAEYTTQIKQPDGSYQLVSRKLEDVLDEIDAEEALGQELMACATGMMAAE
ncbi:hypothetical protein VRZ08_05575 [Rhodopseudomonas sp. G2_2311]|uniref:hypothetical protein n=1 Tax=Rhodopseudomonas sp. G2_2311 TaxID=3114287 RepID=UPI0039C6C6EB